MVYMNASTQGEWASFSRWVTIHPEPWTGNDPVELLQSNMMFPTIDDLCAALPELTERLDPATGRVMQDVHAKDERTAFGGRGGSQDQALAPGQAGDNSRLPSKVSDRVGAGEPRPPEGDPRAVLFTKPRGWMGKAAGD